MIVNGDERSLGDLTGRTLLERIERLSMVRKVVFFFLLSRGFSLAEVISDTAMIMSVGNR